MTGVKGVSIYGDKLHITLENKETGDAILQGLRNAGVVVRDSRDIVPSLEDVFISMVKQ
jgi:ABC-2 type transport system ATP-binding protein